MPLLEKEEAMQEITSTKQVGNSTQGRCGGTGDFVYDFENINFSRSQLVKSHVIDGQGRSGAKINWRSNSGTSQKHDLLDGPFSPSFRTLQFPSLRESAKS
jgi:hypothetical protein